MQHHFEFKAYNGVSHVETGGALMDCVRSLHEHAKSNHKVLLTWRECFHSIIHVYQWHIF